MGNAHEVCALSKMRCVDDIWSWTHDAHLINPEIWKGENDASISIVYVFCSRRSGNGSWLLDITGVARSLRGRSKCPPRRADSAAAPHYRTVHFRRSGLQVRVVL